MRNILITGTSRGLGLGLTKAYLERGDRVFAVLRQNPSDELRALAQQYGAALRLIICDLNDDRAASLIEQSMQGTKLDQAVFNAGIYGPAHQNPLQVSDAELTQLFLSNTIAPVRLAQGLLPRMKAGAVLAFMSSQMASIELARAQDMPLYGASKAALNSLLRSWSQTAPQLNLLALHPGWVRTVMGGEQAPLSIEDSVAQLITVIEAQSGQSGCHFLDYMGQALAW
jgi:NAD(P)-dependent dehydrogenase (short-subunit alcohol dehydrogenase family)